MSDQRSDHIDVESPGVDLVGARAGAVADLAVTNRLREMALAEAGPERGGRWLIAHDLPRLVPANPHESTFGDDRTTLVVGTIDDLAIVGYGLASMSSAGDAELCMIAELFVHPDARSIGVGAAILGEMRTWARSVGCVAIESQVLPGNRAAKNFFERVGMVTRKMRVSADLDESRSG